MKRKHTALEYKNMIKKVRNVRPGISVTSDFIIGYPGELNERIGFDDGYSFIYSRRPGTPASSEPDNISMSEKKKRLSLVQDLIRTNSEKYLSKLVGTSQQVLIEGTSKTDPMKLFGRTFTNKIVNFSGSTDLIGQIIDVKISGSNRNSLDGAL